MIREWTTDYDIRLVGTELVLTKAQELTKEDSDHYNKQIKVVDELIRTPSPTLRRALLSDILKEKYAANCLQWTVFLMIKSDLITETLTDIRDASRINLDYEVDLRDPEVDVQDYRSLFTHNPDSLPKLAQEAHRHGLIAIQQLLEGDSALTVVHPRWLYGYNETGPKRVVEPFHRDLQTKITGVDMRLSYPHIDDANYQPPTVSFVIKEL